VPQVSSHEVPVVVVVTSSSPAPHLQTLSVVSLDKWVAQTSTHASVSFPWGYSSPEGQIHE
jgi:hypothetical protein